MKRLLIKSLALCLLVQPILANPFMMHGMRAHQSMSAMRAALNNQKQNAGIFNNNVQKRQVADVIAITVVVKETVGIIGIVQNICAAGALAGLAHRFQKRKKWQEDFAQNTAEKIEQETAKHRYLYDDPSLYNGLPAPLRPVQKIYPPGFVYGFDAPEGALKPYVPTNTAPTTATTTIAPVDNAAPTQNIAPKPSLIPAVSPGDEKDNPNLEAVGAIMNSGDMVQRGVSGAKDLIKAVNDAATQQNPLAVPPGGGERLTLGDVGTGVGGTIAAGTAAETAAQVVAKKTLWGVIKGAAAPYVEPVGTAAVGTAKAVGAAVVANPGAAAVVATVAVAVVEPMVQEMVRPYEEAITKQMDDTLAKMTTQEVDPKTGEIKEVPTLVATVLGKAREEFRVMQSILHPPTVYEVLTGSEKAKRYAYDALSPLKSFGSFTSIFSDVQSQGVTPGCALPAKDPLKDLKIQPHKPVIEPSKNIGYGSTTPEKPVLTPQEISDVEDQLVLEKNKKGEEKVRANNEPGAPRETGAQAPGMPRAEDGYTPPKNWDGEKVRVEKGKFKGRYGWPDKKGNIWVPSGPDGHGGPHWDVQYPDRYDNVVPGGGIRGEK